MVVIGLVGNIGSGKSLAARFLSERGAAIVDADQISREIVLPGCPAWQEIVTHFGSEYLLPDRNINRKMLGAKVFSNAESLRLLNDITHPYIKAEAARRIKEFQEQRIPLIVLEAAILLDSQLIDLVDEVWLVLAPTAQILVRVQSRDALDEPDVRKRLASQMPAGEQAKRADLIIENSGTIEDLRCKMFALYDEYIMRLQKGQL